MTGGEVLCKRLEKKGDHGQFMMSAKTTFRVDNNRATVND